MSQHTIHKQLQSLSKYTKLCTVNDMLRSFDLVNNDEKLEEKKIIHLIKSFNQLHGLPSY
jgi:hypothetical protein